MEWDTIRVVLVSEDEFSVHLGDGNDECDVEFSQMTFRASLSKLVAWRLLREVIGHTIRPRN